MNYIAVYNFIHVFWNQYGLQVANNLSSTEIDLEEKLCGYYLFNFYFKSV